MSDDTLRAAQGLLDALDANDAANVHGWSVALRKALAASATDEPTWEPLVPNDQLPDGWAEDPTATGMQRGPVARLTTDVDVFRLAEAIRLWYVEVGDERPVASWVAAKYAALAASATDEPRPRKSCGHPSCYDRPASATAYGPEVEDPDEHWHAASATDEGRRGLQRLADFDKGYDAGLAASATDEADMRAADVLDRYPRRAFDAPPLAASATDEQYPQHTDEDLGAPFYERGWKAGHAASATDEGPRELTPMEAAIAHRERFARRRVMCSQADDPSQHGSDNPLRAALERIARINDRDFDAAQDIARAALAASATDERKPKRERIDWSNVVVDEGDEAP